MPERPECVGTQVESIVNNAQSAAASLRAQERIRQIVDQVRVDHPGPTSPNLLETKDFGDARGVDQKQFDHQTTDSLEHFPTIEESGVKRRDIYDRRSTLFLGGDHPATD